MGCSALTPFLSILNIWLVSLNVHSAEVWSAALTVQISVCDCCWQHVYIKNVIL